MKHYELLKLVPGTDPVEVQEKLRKAQECSRIQKELEREKAR